MNMATTKTTTTETETTLPNGATKKVKTTVVECVEEVGHEFPLTPGGITAQAVVEVIDVVERATAVARKGKTFYDIIKAMGKTP
jgi:hypothetical protein